MKMNWTLAAALAAASVFVGADMAKAAEIKVLSSAAIKEAYLELVPAFERATEHKVVTEWGSTNAVVKRVQAGEATVDMLILADYALEELIKGGKVAGGSRANLVRSGIGMAVSAGLPKPDISTVDGLKRALLGAKVICYSTGPSGVYMVKLFERLGIADQLKGKLKQVEGVPVGVVIERGEADLGFQQISELLPVPGIQFVGPLPADVQHISTFAAGLLPGAKEPSAAKSLIDFIRAPAAAPAIKKAGLEPG
jgi:molybdate transport system substrate-binding protein